MSLTLLRGDNHNINIIISGILHIFANFVLQFSQREIIIISLYMSLTLLRGDNHNINIIISGIFHIFVHFNHSEHFVYIIIHLNMRSK